MNAAVEWNRAPQWAAQRALVKSLWSILWRSLVTIAGAHFAATLVMSLLDRPFAFQLYLLEILVLLSVALPTLHLVILRPVTRLAAEQAAAAAELRFRTIAEAIQDGIMIFGADEKIGYANSAARRIYRITTKELAGTSARALVPPHILDIFDQAMGRVHSGAGKEDRRTPGPVEYEALRADGELFPAEVTVSTLQEGGKPQIVLVLRDITERKRAEEALRESERRYRELLELLPVPVRINQDGRIRYSNAADARVFGYDDPREMIGADAYRFISPEDAERMQEYYRQRVAGQDAPPYYRVTAVRKNGETFPCEVIAARIDYQQQPASLLVLRDLSVLQRLELFEQILPVCCVCGKIRDDSGAERGKGEWGRLDDYVRRHSTAQFSHTFCPDCYADFRRREGLG